VADTTGADHLARRAWAFLTELTEHHSPRASATDEEAASADYIAGLFRGLGYDPSVQQFGVRTLAADRPVLALDPATLSSPKAPSFDALPLRLSAERSASGELAEAGLVLGDLPVGSLDGKVALIERGVVPFETKVSRASRAGATAAIIFNNEPGQFGGTLSTQAAIPVVSVSQETGAELRSLMVGGVVRATVSVIYKSVPSRNVVIERPGEDPAAGVVVLGGHFDTVPDVPGANDNGSGTAVLLAIAEAVKDIKLPVTVRFIAFGSEELGLLGSRHYVDSLAEADRRGLIAMLNFDALGTGPTPGVFGEVDLVDRAVGAAGALGLRMQREPGIQGGSSDFASFEASDIPFLFFLAGDFSRIHTPEDRLEFVDADLMGTAAAVAIDLLRGLTSPGRSAP
jgi:aminopeptidase YwaD